jgi:hypothetical protein
MGTSSLRGVRTISRPWRNTQRTDVIQFMTKDDDRSERRINPNRREADLALYHFIADRIPERGNRVTTTLRGNGPADLAGLCRSALHHPGCSSSKPARRSSSPVSVFDPKVTATLPPRCSTVDPTASSSDTTACHSML